MNNNGYLLSIIFGVILVLANLFFLMKSQDSKTWPIVKGKIVSSEINLQHGRSIGYNAVIQFAYVVNGQQYLSDKISFGEFGYRDSRYAELLASRYPPNKMVSVHYNPNNPAESVLEFNEAGIFFYMIVGALFILAGLFIKFRQKNI